MEAGDPAGAERWLRPAVAAEPADAEALHLLVLALRAHGRTRRRTELAGRLEALQQDLRRLTELMRPDRPRPRPTPAPATRPG